MGQKRGEASIKDDGVVISLQQSNNENKSYNARNAVAVRTGKFYHKSCSGICQLVIVHFTLHFPRFKSKRSVVTVETKTLFMTVLWF